MLVARFKKLSTATKVLAGIVSFCGSVAGIDRGEIQQVNNHALRPLSRITDAELTCRSWAIVAG